MPPSPPHPPSLNSRQVQALPSAEHFEEYNDVAGDSPLNLCATSQTFNAYALTGDERYRTHTLEYLDAW